MNDYRNRNSVRGLYFVSRKTYAHAKWRKYHPHFQGIFDSRIFGAPQRLSKNKIGNFGGCLGAS